MQLGSPNGSDAGAEDKKDEKSLVEIFNKITEAP